MELTARDIMETEFETIRPGALVKDAARLIFESKARRTGYKPIGLMVTDDNGLLVGVISMFDIIFNLRPPFMNYELESFNLKYGEFEIYLEHFKDLRVEEVMSSTVTTVPPDCDVMVLVDLMVKKHIHRMPVVEGNKILGIVYFSDIFYHVCRTWLMDAPRTPSQ